MKVHEAKVKSLVAKISNVVNDKEDWKVTITGNNALLDIVEELKNEICKAYVENVDK